MAFGIKQTVTENNYGSDFLKEISFTAENPLDANKRGNRTVASFFVPGLAANFKTEGECFASGESLKKAWINPGGWQSWAPGFEIPPRQKRPSLTCKFVPQWTCYITVPETEKSLYSDKNIILGQFIVYYRIGKKYLAFVSTGAGYSQSGGMGISGPKSEGKTISGRNSQSGGIVPSARAVLPPVQYIINRKKHTLDISVYDTGKAWSKGDQICRIAYFIAKDYFDFRNILTQIFGCDVKESPRHAARFDQTAFLGRTAAGWESWYNHYSFINEKLILNDLAALKTTDNIISLGASIAGGRYSNCGAIGKDGRIEDGVQIDVGGRIEDSGADYSAQNIVFQIDDGWEQALGDWEWNTERFPSGPEEITKKIQETGFVPGLWIAPLIIDYRSKTAQAHPEWLLRDENGKPVDAGFNPIWGGKKGKDQPSKSGTFFCLDISRDDVIEFLDSLIEKAIERWGFRYLKLDFLYAGLLYGKYAKGGAAFAWYDHALQILTARRRNLKGEPVAYLGCGIPFENTFEYFPLSRSGCDTLEHWENIKCKRIGWNGRTSAYLNMKDSIGRALWNRIIFQNDPDVIFVRNSNCSLTRQEKILIATVAVLFGAQFMYSDDPADSCSEEEVALAKEILSIKEKYSDEDFSAVAEAEDIFYVESKSGKYKGILNLSQKNFVYEGNIIQSHSAKIF